LNELQLYGRVKNAYRRIAEQINRSDAQVALLHPCKLTQAPWGLQFLRVPKIYFAEELPRVVYEKDLSPLEQLPFTKRVYEQRRRANLKKIDKSNVMAADKVLCASEFVAEQIKSAYGIKPLVIKLGVDSQFFTPGRVRDKYFLKYYFSTHKSL